MPAVSESQRKYLNAKFGHDWTKKHHFDNAGKLPKHKRKKRMVPAKDKNGYY
jgi:hypothetical protein